MYSLFVDKYYDDVSNMVCELKPIADVHTDTICDMYESNLNLKNT